jgi:signal transduction histidine kinase
MRMNVNSLKVRLAWCALLAAAPAALGVLLALGYVAGQWGWAIAAAVACAFAAGVVGCVNAKRLIQPLTAIVHAHRQVAAGRTDHLLIPGRGGDEIAELAHSFNAMAVELARGQRSIEQRVESRVRELRTRNQELEQACAAAEHARAFKDEFLANMSHEIRTPLTAIIGYAELLVDTPMPEAERVKALQNIQYNGQHLLKVINDVLDVAKLDANKVEVESVEFAPVQLLNDIVTLMRPRAQEKGLKLELEFASRVPELITTDPTRVRQIVLNLVGNAIKFTRQGSVRLVVKVIESDDGQESFVQFAVSDTGIGIDAEALPKLFQPFTQGAASRSREYGGSGLGLVISQRLARLLGGEITVQSTFGEGSIFTATVRIAATHGARMMNPALLPSDSVAAYAFVEDEHAAELKGVRILLADDTRQNRDLMAKMLTAAGATVDVADNGRLACHSAMEKFQSHEPFDVILMDIQMPELNGYEATRRLRGLGYPGAIIALTASASETDRRKCIDCGCSDFARKPIERKKLIELVAKWTKTRSPRPATHAA